MREQHFCIYIVSCSTTPCLQDAQSCLELCQGEGACEFFTYYPGDSTCLGFANCEDFDADTAGDCEEDGGCFSGAKECPGNLHFSRYFLPANCS